MTTYLAITIGPIYKTLYEAKRTRAVWAASYFFSWVMRTILEECSKGGMNIMLPYSTPPFYRGSYGSGLYADRLYFIKDDKTTFEKIKAAIEEVFEKIEKKSNSELPVSFLKQYINLHVTEKVIDENSLNGSYILAVLNGILDNQELMQNYPFDIENNPIQNYIINKAGSDTFLARDAFGETNKIRKFRSVPEIATTTLQRTDTTGKYLDSLREDFKNEDTELIDELKKNGFQILPYHKYYAVLYADGDNIGKMLEQIEKKRLNLNEFSKSLFEFGRKAEIEIAKYGGNGIYLGGEDILAFLPVACVDENIHTSTQSLFSLINKLDERFKETVTQFAIDNGLTIPTLSYGVMISYIKHPLKESMQQAHKLLEKIKDGTSKNAIGIRFQKHSGQYTWCIIEKSKASSTNEIYFLINKYANTLSQDTNEVLSSIIQRFKDDLFFTLFHKTASEKRLDAFFENFFNEDVHKITSPKSEFLKEVKVFSEKVVNDYPAKEDCKNIIFTILRFVHFVNCKRD